MVRNYVCMQQPIKKTKTMIDHYYRTSFSFSACSAGNDGDNETCLKIIIHHDDKKTLKLHLTSDFIGPLPSPFTIQ